jgi:exopolysaccharide biosynthesis protein
VTLTELAVLLARLGARDGLDLDGGGSSTLVLRAPGEPAVSVRNLPSGGRERAVANGIGVFAHGEPPAAGRLAQARRNPRNRH